MSSAQNEEIFTTWTSDLEERNITIVCLCGELDASTVPSFLTDVQKILERHRNMIMDVHLLSYVDSTGVAAILSTQHALKEAERKMGLVGCHGLLTKILQLTRIESELQCFDDMDTAISTVGSTG